MYFWLLNQAVRSRKTSVWFWLYTKYTSVLTVIKHIKRHNWQEAWRWIRFFVK